MEVFFFGKYHERRRNYREVLIGKRVQEDTAKLHIAN